MPEYISGTINEEYKTWERGELVFISSPTGSGKTIFCLETLLKYAAECNMRILYLVNRRILKEQLESEISKLEQKYRFAIDIELYQTLENQTSNFVMTDIIIHTMQ